MAIFRLRNRWTSIPTHTHTHSLSLSLSLSISLYLSIYLSIYPSIRLFLFLHSNRFISLFRYLKSISYYTSANCFGTKSLTCSFVSPTIRSAMFFFVASKISMLTCCLIRLHYLPVWIDPSKSFWAWVLHTPSFIKRELRISYRRFLVFLWKMDIVVTAA